MTGVIRCEPPDAILKPLRSEYGSGCRTLRTSADVRMYVHVDVCARCGLISPSPLNLLIYDQTE